MAQAAKAQEPSMEEILASIRRIIADDDAAKPAGAEPSAAAEGAAAPQPAAESAAEPAAMNQDDIDAMLAGFDAANDPPLEASDAAPSADAFAPVVDAKADDDADDVLELTEAMEMEPPVVAPAPRPAFRKIETDTDLEFADSVEAPAPARRPAASAKSPPPPQEAPPRRQPTVEEKIERVLLSDDTTSAVTAAFGSLAHTVLSQNARTLDDLVREMLRPMLKAWLDDNLPTIVERQVRAEIERVSRGRG